MLEQWPRIVVGGNYQGTEMDGSVIVFRGIVLIGRDQRRSMVLIIILFYSRQRGRD